MDFDILQHDLKRCLTMMTGSWCASNQEQEEKTRFVYQCDKLSKCLAKIDMFNVDKNYALHRWYNYMTSKTVKEIFRKFGTQLEADKSNPDIDVYINGIPFGIQLTSYPNSLIKDRPYDLKTRSGRNDMIKWYYNQKQSYKSQFANRIFVLYDGKDKRESLEMKSDFQLLENKIGLFLEYSNKHGVNEITLDNENKEIKLYSELLLII